MEKSGVSASPVVGVREDQGRTSLRKNPRDSHFTSKGVLQEEYNNHFIIQPLSRQSVGPVAVEIPGWRREGGGLGSGRQPPPPPN